jgi:nucleoid DNA-binding protein
MIKKDFVDEYVKVFGGAKKDAKQYLDNILNLIVAVSKDEEVAFAGFGKFYKDTQAERRCVLNGKEIITPQKEVIKFARGSKFEI